MADPKTFSPKFDEEQIRGVIDQYARFPNLFNDRDDDIQSLEDHAYYYKIPFTRNKTHQDAFVTRMLKQAGAGFMEGFTTLPPEKLGVGREPEDTWEGIARNLGHLSGFVGYLPGGRLLRKLGPLKYYSQFAQGVRNKSIPMQGASFLEGKVKKAIAPALKDLPDWATSGIAPDLAQGAFHLGTASAISSWTHGVDEMFNAAGFGAVAGGVFRGIGNMPGFGKRVDASQMKPNGRPDFSKLDEGQIMDLALRTTAGMAFQGLPSTLQGATTEEQVYQYAMGAFFGFNEIPYQTRTSRQYLAESIKKKYGPDPQLNPKWDTLTKEMKDIVTRDFQETFQFSADGPSESSYLIFDILSKRGMNLENIEELRREYEVAYEVDPITGEANAKGISPYELKRYKDDFIKKEVYEDPQDLDMHIQEVQEVPGRIIGKNGYVDRVYKDLSVVDRIKRGNELYKKWQTLLNEDRKPIPGAEQKIIDFLETTYKQNISEKDRGFWRSYSERLRKHKWVEQIEVRDNDVRVLETETNSLGNQKNLSQEPLIIEEPYRQEHRRVFPKKEPLSSQDQFFRVLDTIIFKNKEYDLSRAESGIARRMVDDLYETKYKNTEADRNRVVVPEANRMAKTHMQMIRKKLIKKMEEDNYYYYGGKGDNKKMYFVKKHPQVEKFGKKISTDVRSKVFTEMRRNNVKDYRKLYEEAKKEWLKEYGQEFADTYDQMYASNVLYDLTINGFSTARKDIAKGIKDVLGEGFINDAKGFNKRQQIWFNTGVSHNPKFVIDTIRNLGKRDISSTNPQFKVGLFSEPDGKNVKLSDLATKYLEISDGAIIAREEVVDALNKDMGLPTEGKLNKSFIVSPDPQRGTMLGKYAIHIASPKLQKFMEQEGVHMLMPESAIKQKGKRGPLQGKLSLENGQVKFDGGYFEVPINHFRTITSEITSSKFLNKQALPKQMFSVLGQYGYKNIEPQAMQDIYESLSGKAKMGTSEGREILRAYKSDPTDKNIQNIVNNINDLPIQEVFYILRDPKQSKLAQKLYEKILRVSAEFTEEMASEGEFSRENDIIYKKASKDYEGMVERIGKLYPEGSVAGYMHKFARDYRMQSLRNYVVKRFTRPEVDNSASSRMRPYEVGLQEKFPKLNTKEGQKIFYLDDGFKELRIRDDIFGKERMTLGKLWEIKQNKYRGYENFKEEIDNILYATVMRVPMDSISGAHGLQFAGFTGIKGYGSLLHPRTMKALGGADLDGDKAFIFFGGESSGFKKKWREMYESNKDEYVDKIRNEEKDNKSAEDPQTKTTYGEQLAERDPVQLKKMGNPVNQYSPYWREYMSRGAYEGRDVLGVAVTNRMALIGAYDAMRNIPEGKAYTMDVMVPKGSKYEKQKIFINRDKYSVPFYAKNKDGKLELKRIVFETKNTEQDLQRFREMSRAAIALGSDPMDEAGLKSIPEIRSKMLETLFKPKVFNTNKKGEATDLNKIIQAELDAGGRDYLKNKGLHQRFLEVNSVLYGRNHLEGRRYTYAEIQQGVKALDVLPQEALNTFLPKLAKDMKGINWSDNMFNHLDSRVFERIYADHEVAVRENEWLKDAMGRTSLASKEGKYLNTVRNSRIFEESGMARLSNNRALFDGFVKEIGGIPFKFRDLNFNIQSNRQYFLENVLLKAEDFFVNDLSDMASLKSISDVARGMDPKRISEIHSKVDEIKSKSVYMSQKRREVDDALRRLSDLEFVRFDAEGNEYPIGRTLKQQIKEARKSFGFDDKATSMNDRIRTDKQIRDYKEPLSPKEKDLFDMLYIGTYSKGDAKTVKAMEKLGNLISKENNPEMAQIYERAKRLSTNTSLIREGIQSKEVSDKNLKTFFTNYEQIIKKTNVELNDAQKEQLQREADGKVPVKSFKDDKGNEIRGEFVDMNQIDDVSKKYLDEVRPFTNLFKGKIKDPEMQRLYDSLTEHLEHYHNLDVVNLNGLFRGLFKKNINEANKVDLQQLDAYFKEMRDGTWWRKTMDYMTGKDKNPSIKRAYYWMFPKAIDRDLMRNPAMMEWVDDVGPYKDHLGNTFENARTVRPTSVIGTIQQLAHRTQELAMQNYEDNANIWRDELRPYVAALKEGDLLFEIAVAKRELNYMTNVLRPQYKNTSSDLTSKEMTYVENWNKVKKEWANLRKKNFIIPTKEGNVKMTGEKVVENIDKIITDFNIKTHKWLTGTEARNKWLDMSLNNRGEVTWEGLDKLRKEFHKYVMKTAQQNKDIPIGELGIDGMRQIVKRIILSQTPKRLRTREALQKARESLEVTPFDITGNLGPQYYFPHMSFNRRNAKNRVKEALKRISEDPELSKEEIATQSKKLLYQYKKMTGDFLTKDEMGDNWDVMQQVMINMANKKEAKAKAILTNDLKRVGNQFSRDAHIGGWELTPEAYEVYMKNAINTFYKQAMQLSARTSMYNFNNSFYEKTGDTKLTNSWMNFFKLYTQSAMGYPTHIPTHVMNDPSMKIGGTAFKWLADSTAKKRIDYISDKLGISKRDLRAFNLDDKTINELSGVEYSQIQGWGALEAKWQLASLLAHPKSSIANLYGGTVHTWVSTGYNNLKRARNFDYLKTNVNPRWESMKDVERWLQKKGVIEEFLVYEAGLNPELKSSKNQAFIKQAIAKIKRDPNFSDESLRSLAKKNGLTDRAFAAASSFMRVPERILRRDSFMAHYLQAREQFGGAISDYNSPFLINYAKRGVKGTQFLYSAPFRPLFTNSTLGRVFARFQLWSWNSVRFRNDVMNRAKIAGYRPGTPEMEAFKRLATADLFMLAMSSLFMYSLFESSLPAPWNWFQDTADYLMGSEKERERAFFGSPIGPLQAVTPPSLRLLPPMFKWLVSGDSERLTDYYLWTIPPFGRIIRDVAGPGGIIENPFYTVTKFTGIPLMQMGQLIKQENPEEARRGRFVYS